MENAQSSLMRFVHDLRRRKVFRSAAAYSVSAWLVVAVADVIFPLIGLPDDALGTVVIIAIAGLPIAIIGSWLFDLTPDGIVRSSDVPDRAMSALDRRIDFVIIGILALVIAWLVFRPDLTKTDLQSIAVLPFDDFTGDSEYLADGIAEELLNSLVTIDGLRVAARTSSFAFKGRKDDVRRIGEQLNVDTVLEGSVQRFGERVRITAQLINVSDGFHIWSQRFERELDDIFLIQDEIASAIVDALKIKLGAEDQQRMAGSRAASFEAYDLYLLGRHHWHQRTPQSLQRAVELFNQATEADPDFARAYSGLADSYLLLRDYGDLPEQEAQALAEAAIARALQLDDQLSEAYASLGLLRLMRKDFVAAELAFRNAIELDASYSMAHMWLGLVLDKMYGPVAAYEEYAAAYRTDPLHPVVNGNLASVLGRMGRSEEAEKNLLQLIVNGNGDDSVRMNLAWLKSSYGKLDQAVEYLLPVVDKASDADKARAILALTFMQLGDTDRAANLISQSDPATEPMIVFRARAELLLTLHDNSRLLELVEQRANADINNDESKMLLMLKGIAQLRLGNLDDATGTLEAFLADSEDMLDPANHLRLNGLLVHAYTQLGNTQAVTRVLDRSSRVARDAVSEGWANPEFHAALAGHYATVGDGVRAMAALKQAVDAGWRDLWAVENDPRFATLRDNDRYRDTVDRIRTDLEAMRARADLLVAATMAMAAT